jgi:hypothetical protein
MAVTLPLVVDTPYFEVEAQLDGVLYAFEFRWNARVGQWFLNLADAVRDPIVSGVAVVVDWPLMRRSADPRMPPGALFAVDTTDTQTDPGLSDLGRRVMLVYFTAAELPLEAG